MSWSNPVGALGGGKPSVGNLTPGHSYYGGSENSPYGWGSTTRSGYNWTPSGSSGGGYSSQFGKWADALGKASSFLGGGGSGNQGQQDSGYRGPFAQGFGGGAGGSFKKIGSSSTLWQPPGAPPHQIIHYGQQGGGGGGSGGGGGGGGLAGAASGAAGGALMGAKIGAAGGPIGMAGGAILGGISGLFCDERLKVDIAPLESTEVNDALAEVAFFVKGLRECA